MTSATRTTTAKTRTAKTGAARARGAKAQGAKTQSARARGARGENAKAPSARTKKTQARGATTRSNARTRNGAAGTARAPAARAATGGYPRDLTLKGRRTVQVRPMGYEDGDALHAFFCAIPEEDLLFLRRDVTDRDVIESWAQDVAAGNTVTLLAERDGRIVGEASIHRSRVPWTAHVGEVRVVVDAGHRTAGLGSALVQGIFLEALDRGVEKIIAEMTTDQKGAITVFQKLGFRIEGLLREHVRDRAGQKRDLVVMAHEVHEANNQLAQWGITDAFQSTR